MAAVDLILLLLLLASVLLGLWRGLVYELLSIAGWVAAFLLAQTFAAWAGAPRTNRANKTGPQRTICLADPGIVMLFAASLQPRRTIDVVHSRSKPNHSHISGRPIRTGSPGSS